MRRSSRGWLRGRDWRARLTAYQTGDSERAYRMEYKLLTPHYREIEKYIHRRFNARHEWVNAPLADIIKAIKNYKP